MRLKRGFWNLVRLWTAGVATIANLAWRASNWVYRRATWAEVLAYAKMRSYEPIYPIEAEPVSVQLAAQERLSVACLDTVEPGLRELARNYVEGDPLFGLIPAVPPKPHTIETDSRLMDLLQEARSINDGILADDIDIGLNASVMNHDDEEDE